MTGEEAITWLENQGWSQQRAGLHRMKALLAALGQPQRACKYVHITGSNGKGSVAAMVASVLAESGYKTGLFTSPHLEDFRERIRVDGDMIPADVLGQLTGQVRDAAQALDNPPSQFELTAAVGFLYFREQHCDIVVLEVGMGGALDATNAIDAPEAAVFTNIGLEHTEYLGNTLEEIARTKAGIIKKGCDVVCDGGGARGVIQGVCRAQNVPFHGADMARLTPLEHTLAGQKFLWDGQKLTIPLLGRHQLQNAATALTVLETLSIRGWRIPWEATVSGLAHVSWPARMEVLRRFPLFLLDGGHNPQCAQAAAECFRDVLDKKVTFLLGFLEEKDWKTMLDILTPFAKDFFCVTPPSPRALPAEDLAAELTQQGYPAVPFPTVQDAVAAARDVDTACFGSLYLAGEVRRAVVNLGPEDSPWSHGSDPQG